MQCQPRKITNCRGLRKKDDTSCCLNSVCMQCLKMWKDLSQISQCAEVLFEKGFIQVVAKCFYQLRSYDHLLKVFAVIFSQVPKYDVIFAVLSNNFLYTYRYCTSHSAYDATQTESNGVKIDGFLYPNFMQIQKKEVKSSSTVPPHTMDSKQVSKGHPLLDF